MINSWHNLITDSSYTDQSLISGEWFIVRFVPDVIAGEIFNIGVVFIDKDNTAHYKLIDNADAFTCLFGSQGKTNINFLLKVVKEVLSNNNYKITPSPHIQYSMRQTAKGSSIKEILEDLYSSMVSLVCSHEAEEIDTKSAGISTKDLRKKVFGLMKQQYPDLYGRVYNDRPFQISNSAISKSMMVEMPIKYYSSHKSHIREEYYGTIVSAAYISEVHRIHNINYLGVTNVMNCCEILGQEINTALIIYQPPVDEYRFTESIRAEVDKELDKCLYGLYQLEKEGYKIQIDIEESPDACLDRALEFIST